MNAIRRTLTFVAAVAMALVIAAPALAAAPAVTYHGVFSDSITYEGCQAEGIASGTWNAIASDEQAVVTFNILVDGKHHVAFAWKAPLVTADGERFAVEFETLAGHLRVSLAGDELTYRIAPYSLGDLSCDAVTYHGTLRNVG